MKKIVYRKRIENVDIGSGDLIFCHSKRLLDIFVRMVTTNNWSHVGMVVKVDGGLYLLESVNTIDDCVDYLTNDQNKVGIRLVPLKQRIKLYEKCGGVGIRRLANRKFSLEDNRKVIKFYQKYLNTKFEKNILEFFRSLRSGAIASSMHFIFGYNKQNISTMFCSELISELFKEVFHSKIFLNEPANNHTPAFFTTMNLESEKYKYNNYVEIIKNTNEFLV